MSSIGITLENIKECDIFEGIQEEHLNQPQAGLINNPTKEEVKAEDNILVKPEFEKAAMAEMIETEEDNEDDDSDFEGKQEINHGSDSDESKMSDNSDSDKDFLPSNKNNIDEYRGSDFESVLVKSYTFVTVKEEPMEDIKNIFKENQLEYEKQKHHQKIFELLFEQADGKIKKIKDLQSQYISKLREAANIKIFTCSLCRYQTINMTNLSCHFLVIHKGLMEQKVFKCNHCHYETNSRSIVRKHASTHHKKRSKGKMDKSNEIDSEIDNEFDYDEDCEIRPKNTKKFKSKTRQETSEKEKFPCTECNYQGRTEDALQKHIKSAHRTNKFGCDLCTFESQDKNALKEHKNTHKKGGDFYCYVCPYRNGSKLTLALHLLRKHNIENEMSKRSKICEICSLPCTSITKLNRHYLSHRSIAELDESEIHKCPEPGCTYQSKTKNNLILHMRTHKAPEFMCEICGFATKRKESYRWHLETHKKLSEIKWIPCPICPYEARTKRHMYQHMKIGVHDGKNRRHIRKRNLQAEGIPVPEKHVVRIKAIYEEATNKDPNRKPKKRRRPRAKKQLVPQQPETSLGDAIISFDELARAIIVKNESS